MRAENRDASLKHRLLQLPPSLPTIFRPVSPIQYDPVAAMRLGFSPTSRQLCRITSPLPARLFEELDSGGGHATTRGEKALLGRVPQAGQGEGGAGLQAQAPLYGPQWRPDSYGIRRPEVALTWPQAGTTRPTRDQRRPERRLSERRGKAREGERRPGRRRSQKAAHAFLLRLGRILAAISMLRRCIGR